MSIEEIEERKESKLNTCWACEKEVDENDLTEVYRVFLESQMITEMECSVCAKLSDLEWRKAMDDKWNKKINEEVDKEFDNEDSRTKEITW